ncbi:hypothetical protein [Flavobacterium sp. 22076]|uniref:hypothetical protein n=1 Tax=unclassified Flavobacterium TaxID=196869 RepID=UPI003F854969
MTAIVGVLNSQGIAIAADSAVTVTGSNVKKVYNKSNKIFTLSKFHPVGIAIYNRADFMGIPLETLIKMYRKNLKDQSFNTLEEYKNDFLDFLLAQLVHVSPEYKKNAFFSFCSWAHLAIINSTLDSLYDREAELDGLEGQEKSQFYSDLFKIELDKSEKLLESYDKANYMTVSFDDYCQEFNNELNDIENYIASMIAEEFEGFSIIEEHKQKIKQLLYELINVEFIFENHCGLVFVGFGESEIFPSSHLVLVGTPIMNNPRIRKGDVIKINPGVVDSNIVPYAQDDVTTTVLTGVDPNYKKEVKSAVKNAFDNITLQLDPIINDPVLSQQVGQAITSISEQLIQGLEQYQWKNITGPLLEILAHMGKEDMSELAESLVNITSLKRKFTSLHSTDESVGGPVDVAIISKADGFIWMKRKHYFDITYNRIFQDKYLKY